MYYNPVITESRFAPNYIEESRDPSYGENDS